MKYGKLVNGEIQYAPQTFTAEDNSYTIINFDTKYDLLRACGYKQVIVTYAIDVYNLEDDTYKYTSEINEDDVNIYVHYKIDDSEDILKQVKLDKIEETKQNLETYLLMNPLVSDVKDGVEKTYTVTKEKQQQMTSSLTTYLLHALPYMLKNMEVPEYYTIKWNAAGEECVDWTFDDFSKLCDEVFIYVQPLVSIQQSLEVKIRQMETQKEIVDLDVKFTKENLETWKLEKKEKESGN